MKKEQMSEERIKEIENLASTCMGYSIDDWWDDNLIKIGNAIYELLDEIEGLRWKVRSRCEDNYDNLLKRLRDSALWHEKQGQYSGSSQDYHQMEGSMIREAIAEIERLQEKIKTLETSLDIIKSLMPLPD